MFINSPGGSVISGLGIYDTMRHVSPEIGTICTGPKTQK
jgi:ATP-dependent Clp protease protease subunit